MFVFFFSIFVVETEGENFRNSYDNQIPTPVFCRFKFSPFFSVVVVVGFTSVSVSISIERTCTTHYGNFSNTHTTCIQSKTSYINHCKALKLAECSRHKQTKRWKHDTSYPLSISFWRDSVTKTCAKNIYRKRPRERECTLREGERKKEVKQTKKKEDDRTWDTMQTSYSTHLLFAHNTFCWQRLFVVRSSRSMFNIDRVEFVLPSERKHSKNFMFE